MGIKPIPASMSADRAFSLFEPSRWRAPLVVSAPHAGVQAPAGFRLPKGPAGDLIAGLSDTRIDRLARPAAQALGFPLLASVYLRAFVDLNRGEDELDPLLIDGLPLAQRGVVPGSRVASGLGVIPRLADAHTPIYKDKLSLAAVRSRLRRYYRPYHDALSGLIKTCLAHFGCLLYTSPSPRD